MANGAAALFLVAGIASAQSNSTRGSDPRGFESGEVRASAPTTPDAARSSLTAGNRRFAAGQSLTRPQGEGTRRTLARGQSPLAIIVTTTDSRVAPEHVFNAGLGELFVIRVDGPVCAPETLASIEYAASRLGVSMCVVLGHDDEWSVRAAVQNTRVGPTQTKLIERIRPAVERARAEGLGGTDLLRQAETETVYQFIDDSLRRSRGLRRLTELGRFQMVGAQYSLETGLVEWLADRGMPGAEAPTVAAQPPRARGLPPHVALTMLQAGHRRFLGHGATNRDVTPLRRQRLAVTGARPLAIVVAPSDSRVSPEILFDAGLGDVQVVRTAGNVLTDEVQASIENAVDELGVGLVLVLGSNNSGVLATAADQHDATSSSPPTRKLLAGLQPALAAARMAGMTQGQQMLELAAEMHAQHVVAQLRRRSARLREHEQNGHLGILPALYDVTTGDIRWLQDQAIGAHATPHAAPGLESAHGNHGHGDHGNHGHGATGHDEHAVGHGDHGEGGGNAHAPHGADHSAHGNHGGSDHGSHTASQAGHGRGAHQSHGEPDHGATHSTPGNHGGHQSHGEPPHGATHSAPGSHGDHGAKAHVPHGHGPSAHASAAHGDHTSHGHEPLHGNLGGLREPATPAHHDPHGALADHQPLATPPSSHGDHGHHSSAQGAHGAAPSHGGSHTAAAHHPAPPPGGGGTGAGHSANGHGHTTDHAAAKASPTEKKPAPKIDTPSNTTLLMTILAAALLSSLAVNCMLLLQRRG